MDNTQRYGGGVEVHAPVSGKSAEILTPEAVEFVAKLARRFTARVQEILAAREDRQERINAGEMPGFLQETRHIREGDWKVAPVPQDLQDRRVEITGPPDRKMAINAMNSGAQTYMTDFEDSNCPKWQNMMDSQVNLADAVRREITYDAPDTGKHYELIDDPAILIARPRGLHLFEKHMTVDGREVPASIFDFGLYFFHNARELVERGFGPYFYLPKLEGHLEARLWNEIFVMAQEEIGLPQGTIKACVLVETILATFEMDEILYELREHSAGLNCGRWDYIFSYLKKFREHDLLLPDRSQITMTAPFMRAYSQLTVKTCHKRGAHAIGGMAAQIPVKDDPEKNEEAYAAIRADKEREVADGHDGTWVAHPAMVSTAREVFDEEMPQANQIDTKPRDDFHTTVEELLARPDGQITEQGFRNNISIGIQYLGAWLAGRGAVPVFNLMEDTATAEISRSQVWQWIYHRDGVLEDGRNVDAQLFRQMANEELWRIRELIGEERFKADEYEEAAEFFDRISTSEEFVSFLTIPAYEYLD